MDCLGKYEVIRSLGRGGMGEVFLARDPDLDRQVALKVLLEQYSNDADFVRRFEEEARAVARLFHPHIVPINALGHAGDRLIIEMPYVERGSLADLMGRQGGRCGAIVQYCLDVLDALTACHRLGIVHRDVKPSNVLLDTNGRALLGDFGLAKAMATEAPALQDNTTTSVFLGTPRYAPLEAWTGQKATPAWDVYSVGVMLYEGLTGSPLYHADTLLAHLHALEDGPPADLEQVCTSVSKELSEVVSGLLSPDPRERPSEAIDALRKLRATPEGEAAVVSPSSEVTAPMRMSLPAGFRPRRRRRRWVAIGTVVSLAMFLVAGVIALAVSAPHEGLATPRQHGAEVSSRTRGAQAETDTDPRRSFMGYRARDATHFHALVSGSTSDGTMSALVFEPLRIIDMRLAAGDGDTLAVSGRWGRYTDRGALEVMYGEVNGAAHWLLDQHVMSLTLVFTGPNYGVRWEEDWTLTVREAALAEEIERLEHDDYLIPLMVTELAERDPRWLEPFSRWVPGHPAGRLDVLHVGDGDYALDGRDDEPFWRDTRAYAVPNRGTPEGGLLRAATVKEGLLIHCRVLEPVSLDWEVAFAVQPGYSLPVKESLHFYATFTREGWQTGRRLERGQATRWVSDWPVGHNADDGNFSVEILVPFASVGADAAAVRFPWRVNLSVRTSEDGSTYAWGHTPTDDTQHGLVVLALRDKPESGGT
jgi:hypothetical protein